LIRGKTALNITINKNNYEGRGGSRSQQRSGRKGSVKKKRENYWAEKKNKHKYKGNAVAYCRSRGDRASLKNRVKNKSNTPSRIMKVFNLVDI